MTITSLSDDYLARFVELDPVTATNCGVGGHDDRLTDLSPEGHQQRADLARATLTRLRATAPLDAGEAVAADVLGERLRSQLELHESGVAATALNLLASPVQDIRMVFTLAEPRTFEDWKALALRLRAVDGALRGLRRSLTEGAQVGRVAARRQVLAVAQQCEAWAGGSAFDPLVAQAWQVPDAPVEEVDEAASEAAGAFAAFARFLRDELVRVAPAEDAVGTEVHGLWLRHFLGTEVDPLEAYAWGWEEFHRIESEIRRVAATAESPVQVANRLDADPRYRAATATEFEAWLQRGVDSAMTALRGAHFDIDAAVTRLECRISPEDGATAAYYTAPSADLTRPGRVWWRAPTSTGPIPTWRELSRVHHEGVPGHHLQQAAVVAGSAGLNRFQRLLCDVPGHSEGWALYAERLMAELGFLDDPGFLLGMLDGQLLRAARVILDIGLHLRLPVPGGSAPWTPARALEFLRARTTTDPALQPREVARYLGWPGQAVSYKLGERAWLAAREAYRARLGHRFDLKAFHGHALGIGPMGLGALREHLLPRP
ncbi:MULTISPECIES: DUF885 domain-containing protein [Actinosynnema]|uniref:DUF885 domain-containing protein n=1 Tax=Actinosynnema TaxID=40566 RepID=UPI0020A42872|nr:DUF885 domain-containing protein [Actinosynnema pretiosum]